jgi:predicted RNA-binding protein with TRAM domain
MEREFSRPRFGDRGFDRFEKPVKAGEEYDVEIKETGSKGDGIARVKNFVVFVANSKKDEKCRIKITQVARRFAIGEKIGELEVTKGKKEVEEKPEEKIKKEEKIEKKEVKPEKVSKKEITKEETKPKEKAEKTEEKKEEKPEEMEEDEELEGEDVED